MHVVFNPDGVEWDRFIQTGGGAYFSGVPYQRGYGAYFSGVPYQRGYGVGAIVGSVVRFLLPMLRTVGRELGTEGLAAGARILGDVAKGKKLRSAVVDETSDGLRNLIERNKPQEKLVELIDRAQTRLQRGSGKKRRPQRRTTTTTAAPRKARRVDALGYY